MLLLFLDGSWSGSDDGLLRQLNGGRRGGLRNVEHGRRRLLGGHRRRLKEDSEGSFMCSRKCSLGEFGIGQ